MIPQQYCWKCKRDLSIDAFAPSKQGKRGSACRECQNEISRQNYQANKERVLARTGQYQREHREQSRGYNRKWYQKNPEYFAKWQKGHTEQVRTARRKWYQRHPERAQEGKDAFKSRYPTYRAEHYAKNRERYREQGAAYYSAHKEQKLAYGRRWRAANPAKARNLWMHRHARVRNATIHPVDLNAVLARDGWICHICGEMILPSELSFDHIIPFAKGGMHSEENLSPAHSRCNKGKQARLNVPSLAPPRIRRAK